MTLRYSSKWTGQWGTESMQKEARLMWAKDMAGLTQRDVKHAFDQLLTKYPLWPPTVGEFVMLCKQGRIESLNIPNYGDAFNAIVNPQSKNANQSNLIIGLKRKLESEHGLFNVRAMNSDKASKIIKTAYDHCVQEVISGKVYEQVNSQPVVDTSFQIENNQYGERDKEIAKKSFNEMRNAIKKQ